MKPRTRVSCFWLISGPLAQPSSLGAPSLNVFAIAAMPSTTRSYTPRCTKIRDPHTQPWPECTKMPIDARNMALSRLASSKISTGDLPPSSSMSFLRLLPGGRAHDLLAALGRPGEGALLHVGRRGDRGARGGAVAGQQVDDAIGYTGLVDEPVEQQCRQRQIGRAH